MTSPKPVFIHVSKNAGNSVVESAGEWIINAGHRTAASWVAEHGSAAPLFAVIRNPFDRVVSEYHFRRRRLESGERNPHLANLLLPFKEWVIDTFRHGHYRTRSFFDRTGVPFNAHNMVGDTLIWFLPQVHWLSAEDGTLLVSEMLRFENLMRDWSDFAARHGIPVRLAHSNASPRSSNYRRYYDDESRQLIEDYYGQDLTAFGYGF